MKTKTPKKASAASKAAAERMTWSDPSQVTITTPKKKVKKTK